MTLSDKLQLCEQTESQWQIQAEPDPIRLILTRSDEGWIQGFYPIGGHDNFHVSPRVKAVQLVEQLQHGPLDLPLTARVWVIPTQHRQVIYIYLRNVQNPLHRPTSSDSCYINPFNWVVVFSMWGKKPGHIYKLIYYLHETTSKESYVQTHVSKSAIILPINAPLFLHFVASRDETDK